MEKNDEENEIGPNGESNNSQETGEGGDTNNNSDSSSDSSEQGNEFYENLSSESSSTVLVSENKEEMQESDQDELEREIEKELEEGVEAINKYLEEEAEFINAYQEMVEKERALDGERELEGDERQKTDEEWEKEVETAAYTAEQLYESMGEIETNTINEEISEIKEELEIKKEAEQSEEISEPQLSDTKEENSGLYEEVDKEKDELEQHQVESAIQEELETEPESIINEKEVEKLQELDVEEQFQMVHFNEYMDELVEKQNEEAEKLKEQEEQVEKEELEAQASKIKEANLELYEEVDKEKDELEQHQVESAIQEEFETEPEPIINEKEVEKLQELDVEEQFQMVHFNEYIDELVERQDEDKNIENDKIKQEKENIEQTQDVIHQSTYLQEKLEEQEQELELDYEEKDIVEQHQVEAAIEEELKTEPNPIVNEEELEYVKNLEPEKQVEAELFYEFIEELANKQNEEKEEREENEEQEEISTEQKIAQITRELDIPQEINADETEVESNGQEGELEQEPTFPDEGVVEQLEIEESKDHRQELEEILEQNRKIEQEALIEIEQEKEDLDKTIEKNYERVKRLYKQQTGKRPIYANKETQGFKRWLEQKKKSEEKEKTKKKKELKEEQKKEEGWKRNLKRWIEEASEEECNSELKSELKKALESYNEFEYLTRKFLELYKKSQREKLTEIEKNRLKSLTERLQGLGPIQLELLENIRAFKDYFNNNLWQLMNRFFANRVRSKFFKHISQIYKNLKQAQKKKENSEEILKNWIEQASEEEISLEMKVKLIEIVENYNELEELAIRFMELYKKEQFEQISQSEKVELKSLIKTLEKLDPINIVLFANIRAIKRYLNDQHLDDFLNKTRVNRVISKFFNHISQKILKLKELINPNEKLKLKKCQLIENQECVHSRDLVKHQNSVKNIEVNKNSFKNSYMVQRYNIKFSDEEIEFLKNHDIEWTVLKSRWAWVEQHPELITAFITEVIAPQHEGRRITKNDLRNLKFRGLEEAIKKTNKSWGQLIDEAGFTSGKPGGHYISETEKSAIYNLTKRAIDRYLDSDNKNKPSPLSELTKAEGLNVTNNTFIKYAKEYLIGRFGEKKGIDLFCKRWLGITSEELLFLRKYNYDPDNLKSRWDWLKKSLAIRFYKEIIRPKFDHTPIWEELKNTLGGFRNKLKLRTGLTYNQLITESADSPSSPCDFKKVKKTEFNDEELNFFKNYNIDWRNLKTRWDWIINDPNPPHLSVAFFKDVLYPLENGVPHQEIMRRVGYRTFFEKIIEIGETWESLVTKAGCQYRPPVQTECIPENKTQLIWQITQDYVDSFLEEDIIPPPIYILVYINSLDINRGTFAKYARNYLIDTYGEMRGNELFDSMWSVALNLTLGRINHILINRVLTENFNQYYIKFISEPNIYPTQRPDGVLLIDEYTIQFFSQNQAVLNFLGISINDLKNVKLIVFDYTSDISDARVVKKIKKYQHPEVFLFIVGTQWCGDVLMKTLPDSNEIKFPGNIRIINYKVLYSLVRLSTELIQMFDLIVKLSELNKLDVLESLIESYKIELYKTNMLKDILIEQNKIIFKINEYLDFGKREYKIKTTLSKEEINYIMDPIYLAERVIVIDIETTGFDSSLDKIIEIGIVELNLKTKEKIILFNSLVYEEGVDLHKNSESFTMSSLNYSDIIDAPSLESLKDTLQFIFDNFRMTSFNINFDLRFLESRGFIFPKKLKDMMSHTREILPKGDKYNFEYAYHFFYNSSKNKGGNYLRDADYIQQHQAIDDAMYEVELLYFLYHEFKYPLDYQCEITNNINKSYTKISELNYILNCNQNDNKFSCSNKNRHKKKPNKKDFL